MNNIIHFNCKWIENAVHDCLQKKDSDITLEDIEKITYLKIGEGFDNTFIIEMSIAVLQIRLKICMAEMNGRCAV